MPRRDFLDRHGETAQWAQRHKIATLLNNMVWHLTEAKPEDPLDDLLRFMTGVNAQLVAMEKREQKEAAEKQKAKAEGESNGGAADKPTGGKDSGKDGTSGKSKAAQERAKVIEKRIRREKTLAATLKEGESSPARTERKKSKKQDVAPLTDVEKELTAEEEDEGNNKEEATDKTDPAGPAATSEHMEPALAPSETEQNNNKEEERTSQQQQPEAVSSEEAAEGEEELDAERRRAAAEAVDDASASAIEVRQEARREESVEGTTGEEGPSDKSVLAIQARLRQRQAKADHEARLREAEEKP